MAILSAISSLLLSSTSMMVQIYLKDAQVVPIVISSSTSLIFLGLSLGSIFGGKSAQHFPIRRFLSLCYLLGVSSVGILASLPGPIWTLIVVFFHAFFMSCLTPAIMSLVSVSSPIGTQRDKNLSFVSASRSLGWMLGRVLGGVLLAALTYRWSFLVLLLTFLWGIFCLFPLRGHMAIAESGQVTYVLRKSLKNLYIALILRQMGIAGVLSLIFVYMSSFLRINPNIMGLLSALNHGSQVWSMLLFGRFANVIGRRNVFLIGFGLSTFVPLIFLLFPNTYGMAVGFVVLGISFGSLYVGSSTYVGTSSPSDKQVMLFGLLESSRGLGGTIGPLLAGFAIPYLGFHGMFLLMASLLGIGFSLVGSGTRHELLHRGEKSQRRVVSR